MRVIVPKILCKRGGYVDVYLIAPMEVSYREADNFREMNIKNDVDKLSDNIMGNIFMKQYRENIGIGALAAYLEQHKINVVTANLNIEQLSPIQIVDNIIKEQPIVVGISLLYDLHVVNALYIAISARKKGYKGHITFGGPFSSCAYNILLSITNSVDSVIRGDGEIPLLQLFEYVKNGKDWREIKGICWNDCGKVVTTGFGENEKDLSILPKVRRDAMIYLRERQQKVHVASIYGSRGCMGACTYCSAPVISKLSQNGLWRCRSAESIVEEIEYLVHEFGVDYLYFCDDNFFGYGPNSNERLEKLATGIINEKLNIRFHAEVRVDTRVDIDLLKLLKKAGLKDVLLGIESGSQKTLNRWKKGTTVTKNKDMIRLLKNLGFNIEPSMIMIDPLTTEEEFIETIDFIIETEIYNTATPLYLFNQMIIFPGTRIETELLEKGIVHQPSTYILDEFINQPDDLVTRIRKILNRSYVIQNYKLDKLWKVLIYYVNQLLYMVEEKIPYCLSYEKNNLNEITDKEELILRRNDYLDKVSAIKKWRQNYGELINHMLITCKQWILDTDICVDETVTNLDVKLYTLIQNYNKRYLSEYEDITFMS